MRETEKETESYFHTASLAQAYYIVESDFELLMLLLQPVGC